MWVVSEGKAGSNIKGKYQIEVLNQQKDVAIKDKEKGHCWVDH